MERKEPRGLWPRGSLVIADELERILRRGAAAFGGGVGGDDELGLLGQLVVALGGGRSGGVVAREQHDTGDAERDGYAERHVGDQRVALGVVGGRAGWLVIEVVLGAERLDTEDGADDRAGACDAERYVRGDLAARGRRRRGRRRRRRLDDWLWRGRGRRRLGDQLELLLGFLAAFHLDVDFLRLVAGGNHAELVRA